MPLLIATLFSPQRRAVAQRSAHSAVEWLEEGRKLLNDLAKPTHFLIICACLRGQSQEIHSISHFIHIG